MPKIYLDEIDAVLSSTTCSSLSTDSQEGKNLNESLDSYINSSQTTLKGAQWDKSRGKMQVFNEALKMRMELANKLAEAIKRALTILKDYLGEDAMLDTSQLPDYQNQRQACQESINKLNAMLTETTTVTYKDSDGVTKTKEEPAYDRASIQAQINIAQETLTELDRIIKKIEGLEEVYNQALEILQDAFAGISSFQTAVGAITPSGIYQYKPKAKGTATSTATATSTPDTTTSTLTQTPSATETAHTATQTPSATDTTVTTTPAPSAT